MKNHKHVCPDGRVLERLAARRLFSEDGELGFTFCNDCRATYRRLQGYYELLRTELQKPIDSKVIDFVRQLGTQEVNGVRVVAIRHDKGGRGSVDSEQHVFK